MIEYSWNYDIFSGLAQIIHYTYLLNRTLFVFLCEFIVLNICLFYKNRMKTETVVSYRISIGVFIRVAQRAG